MEEGRVRIATTPPSQGGAGGGYFVYDYFLSDHLGNTRVVLTDDYNVSGPIIEAASYYPHGLKMAAIGYKAAIGVANPSQYQGGASDFEEETGWNSFALRNYDPQTGRFVQQDPFDQFASGYMGMGNDPVNNADPSGGLSMDFGTLGQVTGSELADRALVTLAGAAAGYGIDRAMGGNGWKGAAAGGAMALGGTFVPPFDIGTVVASGADFVANGIKQNGISTAAASQVTATQVSNAVSSGSQIGGNDRYYSMSAEGQLQVHLEKSNSNNVYLMNYGGTNPANDRYLSISNFNPNSHGNNILMTKLIGSLINTAGGIGLVRSYGFSPNYPENDVVAYTNEIDKSIFLNTNRTVESDYYSILNAIEHEVGHLKFPKPNKEYSIENLKNHANVYLYGFSQSAFSKAPMSDREGYATSFSNYLYNIFMQNGSNSINTIRPFLDEFQKLKTGISITWDFSGPTYRGRLLLYVNGTPVHYKQINE